MPSILNIFGMAIELYTVLIFVAYILLLCGVICVLRFKATITETEWRVMFVVMALVGIFGLSYGAFKINELIQM